MSTTQDLNQPHKCLKAKCKGLLKRPAEEYGEWVYWHPGQGWMPTPPEGMTHDEVPQDKTSFHN